MRGDLIADASISYGELNVTTTPEAILALLTFLRDDPRCGFVSMIDICGVDWPQREQRFDVVYHLRRRSRTCASASSLPLPMAYRFRRQRRSTWAPGVVRA